MNYEKLFTRISYGVGTILTLLVIASTVGLVGGVVWGSYPMGIPLCIIATISAMLISFILGDASLDLYHKLRYDLVTYGEKLDAERGLHTFLASTNSGVTVVKSKVQSKKVKVEWAYE